MTERRIIRARTAGARRVRIPQHKRCRRALTAPANRGAFRLASRASSASAKGLASETRADSHTTAAPLFSKDRTRSRGAHEGPETSFRVFRRRP